jgi:hypothetical protein
MRAHLIRQTPKLSRPNRRMPSPTPKLLHTNADNLLQLDGFLRSSRNKGRSELDRDCDKSTNDISLTRVVGA